jgi:hypothetical protein
VIRADRELLPELARLNSDVVPLAMRIMGNGATSDEQRVFAQRLIAMVGRLQARASVAVIEDDVWSSLTTQCYGSLRADCTQSGTCGGGGEGVWVAVGLGRLGARLPPVCWVAVLEGLAGTAGAGAAAPTGASLGGF